MTEQDKLRVRQLDDKSDYSLWHIRVLAAISSKKLTNAMSEISRDADLSTYEDHAQQSSNIIIATLSDQALHVVQSVIGKPKDMMNKRNDCYDSKSTATKIAKMSELVYMRYTTLKNYLSSHIDRMVGLLKQLKAMGNSIDNFLSIGTLFASI